MTLHSVIRREVSCDGCESVLTCSNSASDQTLARIEAANGGWKYALLPALPARNGNPRTRRGVRIDICPSCDVTTVAGEFVNGERETR